MQCTNCGQENSRDAQVCANCDQRLANTQAQTPPLLTPVNIAKESQSIQYNSPSDADTADTLLAAFVGEKYDSYYRDKWFKDSQPRLTVNNNGASIHSFNFAGFFFGAFWLCYRKMYLLAFSVMIIITIIDLMLMYTLGVDSYGSLSTFLFIGTWIVVAGILGNYFYFDTAVRAIKKATSTSADLNEAKQHLAEKRGASWAGAIVGGILLILLSSALTYFFAPEWYWVI